ncbi:hypothetical protein ACJX0J_020137, partial [Zea mays]
MAAGRYGGEKRETIDNTRALAVQFDIEPIQYESIGLMDHLKTSLPNVAPNKQIKRLVKQFPSKLPNHHNNFVWIMGLVKTNFFLLDAFIVLPNFDKRYTHSQSQKTNIFAVELIVMINFNNNNDKTFNHKKIKIKCSKGMTENTSTNQTFGFWNDQRKAWKLSHTSNALALTFQDPPK